MTSHPRFDHRTREVDDQQDAATARPRRRPMQVVCSPTKGCELVYAEDTGDDDHDAL